MQPCQDITAEILMFRTNLSQGGKHTLPSTSSGEREWPIHLYFGTDPKLPTLLPQKLLLCCVRWRGELSQPKRKRNKIMSACTIFMVAQQVFFFVFPCWILVLISYGMLIIYTVISSQQACNPIKHLQYIYINGMYTVACRCHKFIHFYCPSVTHS